MQPCVSNILSNPWRSTLSDEKSEGIPDIYCDGVQMGMTPFDMMIWLLQRPPGVGGPGTEVKPIHVGTIRMSLEHAKVFAIMLRKNLKQYEDQTGQIPMHPDLMQKLGISKAEDW